MRWRACRAPDAGGGAGGEPLFAGPRDLRATLRKHMVAMSEEDKLTEVLGAKRPRSSQVKISKCLLSNEEAVHSRCTRKPWRACVLMLFLNERQTSQPGMFHASTM